MTTHQVIALATLMASGTFAHGADLPRSTTRSRSAIARVTPALSRDIRSKGLILGSPIFIRIFKESKELEVWISSGTSFKLFRNYPICYFSGELGPKMRKGDGQSPEGFYSVKPVALNPASQFHLSFNIGYPNTYDRSQGRTGSEIMVHGNCVSIGCYAMTDAKIEEIYALADTALRNGQRVFGVHIFPFRMTTANMVKYKNSPHIDFWWNLKEGYDSFEKSQTPPDGEASRGRYVFKPQPHCERPGR